MRHLVPQRRTGTARIGGIAAKAAPPAAPIASRIASPFVPASRARSATRSARAIPPGSPAFGTCAPSGVALPALAILLGALLGAASLAAPALAQDPPAYSGSMEPCLAPHGDRDLYRAGLQSTGWVDVSEAGREVAVAMIADAFLPVTATAIGLPWPDLVASRAEARAFWTDLSQGRTIMEREGRVLLLAGFRDDTGEMRVECWTAGPQDAATDGFFALAGEVLHSDGVWMAALGIAADDQHPRTEILVSRLAPPAPVDPALAATDGLRTTITFLVPGTDP